VAVILISVSYICVKITKIYREALTADSQLESTDHHHFSSLTVINSSTSRSPDSSTESVISPKSSISESYSDTLLKKICFSSDSSQSYLTPRCTTHDDHLPSLRSTCTLESLPSISSVPSIDDSLTTLIRQTPASGIEVEPGAPSSRSTLESLPSISQATPSRQTPVSGVEVEPGVPSLRSTLESLPSISPVPSDDYPHATPIRQTTTSGVEVEPGALSPRSNLESLPSIALVPSDDQPRATSIRQTPTSGVRVESASPSCSTGAVSMGQNRVSAALLDTLPMDPNIRALSPKSSQSDSSWDSTPPHSLPPKLTDILSPSSPPSPTTRRTRSMTRKK